MTMVDRVRRVLATTGTQVVNSLPPIAASARTLSGVQPLNWATTLFNVRNIDIPIRPEVRSSIVLHQATGRIVFEIEGATGFSFYVECNVALSDPGMELRWDALTGEAGPVNGTAVRDPGTGLWYFATPPVTAAGSAFITVDAMVGGPWPNDATCAVYSCALLAFQ